MLTAEVISAQTIVSPPSEDPNDIIRELLEKYRFDMVLCDSGSALASLMRTDSAWAPVEDDGKAALFRLKACGEEEREAEMKERLHGSRRAVADLRDLARTTWFSRTTRPGSRQRPGFDVIVTKALRKSLFR